MVKIKIDETLSVEILFDKLPAAEAEISLNEFGVMVEYLNNKFKQLRHLSPSIISNNTSNTTKTINSNPKSRLPRQTWSTEKSLAFYKQYTEGTPKEELAKTFNITITNAYNRFNKIKHDIQDGKLK